MTCHGTRTHEIDGTAGSAGLPGSELATIESGTRTDGFSHRRGEIDPVAGL
jgi:hypothetical protein